MQKRGQLNGYLIISGFIYSNNLAMKAAILHRVYENKSLGLWLGGELGWTTHLPYNGAGIILPRSARIASQIILLSHDISYP